MKKKLNHSLNTDLEQTCKVYKYLCHYKLEEQLIKLQTTVQNVL